MNNQEICLNKLIKSSTKIVTSFPMGLVHVGLNFYHNTNGNVLILIGSFNEEAKYQYLNDYGAISKGELFLRFSTGCTGPSSIDQMLESFDEYNDGNVSGDISAFLKSLETSKIIICYSELYGASTAIIVMLYSICKKISKDCVPVIIKPASFKGRQCFKLFFIDLLAYLEAYNYLIYDESLCVNKLGAEATMNEFKNTCEAELLEIASSIMEQ